MLQMGEGTDYAQSTKLASRGHPESEAVLVVLAEDGAYRPVYVGPVGGVECLREGRVQEAVAVHLVAGLPMFALAKSRTAAGYARRYRRFFCPRAHALVDGPGAGKLGRSATVA